VTMHFGRPFCIRCSQPGHLSHQCKQPVMPPQPPVKKEEPTVEQAQEQLHDLYDDYLTGG
jgi:hypothetical protein